MCSKMFLGPGSRGPGSPTLFAVQLQKVQQRRGQFVANDTVLANFLSRVTLKAHVVDKVHVVQTVRRDETRRCLASFVRNIHVGTVIQ